MPKELEKRLKSQAWSKGLTGKRANEEFRMVTETRSLTKETKKGMIRCTAHVVHSHGMTRCILDYDHNFNDHIEHEGLCSLEDCLHPHIIWESMFENWLSDNVNNDDTVG